MDEIKAGIFSDRYVTKLAILDHLRECLEKDNYLKAIDANKNSNEYSALDKELMDLNILLEIYFSTNDELRTDRIKKFLENAKNN